jgi:hypothetical protein
MQERALLRHATAQASAATNVRVTATAAGHPAVHASAGVEATWGRENDALERERCGLSREQGKEG